jgi:hypothetical protein
VEIDPVKTDKQPTSALNQGAGMGNLDGTFSAEFV